MAIQSVSTYPQYMKALRDAIQANSNEMLSALQIQQFIARYDLHTRFGITNLEVRQDAEKIVSQIPVMNHPEYIRLLRAELLPKAKYGLSDYDVSRFLRDHDYKSRYKISVEDVRDQLAQLVNGKWIPIVTRRSAALDSSREYRNALCRRMMLGGDIPLGEAAIKVLLKRNGFDKTLGLDVETVIQDMYSLPNKYNMLVLVGANSAPHTEETSFQTASKHREKQTPTSPETAQRNATAAVTEKFEVDAVICTGVEFALNHNIEALREKRQFASILRDLLPSHRREINILMQIYDLGIIGELDHCQVIDKFFIDRFTIKTVNEYGTSEALAKSMILVWCVCYGKDVRNLKMDVDILRRN